MKEFISGLAMLLLLSVFLVQFTANQITHDKLLFVQKDIEAYLQDVKQEGCFTDTIISDLETALSQDLKQNSTEGISVTSSVSTPVERGELIDYTITVKIEGVLGGINFLNSDIDEIEKTYTGYVSSEYTG